MNYGSIWIDMDRYGSIRIDTDSVRCKKSGNSNMGVMGVITRKLISKGNFSDCSCLSIVYTLTVIIYGIKPTGVSCKRDV